MGVISFLKDKLNSSTNKAINFIGGYQYFGRDFLEISPTYNNFVHEGYISNPFVYMCVDFIASRAKEIDIDLVKSNRDGTKEIINSGPEFELLQRPNPNQTKRQFLEQVYGYNRLVGNSYIWKEAPSVGNNAGRPRRLWVLPSQFAHIQPGKSFQEPIKHYEFNIFKNNTYEPEEIIHFRTASYDYNNYNQLYGQSPLRAALDTLNLSNSTVKAMAKQAQNSGAEGLLMYSAKDNDGATINQTQMDELRGRIDTKFHGPENKGKIVGVPRMFKWQQIAQSAADMQLLEDHNLTRDDICAIYQLSSTLFNDHTSSTYNNIKEVKKAAYTNAIIPLVEGLCEELTKSLLANQPNLEFQPNLKNIEELKEDRGELVKTLEKAWWISTSKKQEMCDVEPDGTLSEFYIPRTLVDPNQSAQTNEDLKNDIAEISRKQYKY